jgi:hypothetical protein
MKPVGASAGTKERTDQAVVQVENLVGQRCRRVEQDGDGRGVTPLGLILLKLVHGCSSAFTRETHQPVLVNATADIRWQPERADGLQAFDVRQNGFRARLAR